MVGRQSLELPVWLGHTTACVARTDSKAQQKPLARSTSTQVPALPHLVNCAIIFANIKRCQDESIVAHVVFQQLVLHTCLRPKKFSKMDQVTEKVLP